MHKVITMAAFLALIGAPAALAQSGTNAQSGSAATQSSRTAPIGHRQPRASDVPSENSQNGNPAKIDADEAALDRKIKSICRGC
jgi:hypothetical protein